MNSSSRPLITALFFSGALLLNACKDQTIALPEESEEPSLVAPEIIIEPTIIDAPKINDATEEITKEPQSSNPTKLITDLGFSETQLASPDLQSATPKHTPYCLDKPVEKNTKTTIEDACLRISNRLASVSMESCLTAKLEHTGCYSVLDSPIIMRNFAPIKGKTPQGRILIIGGTHADELTSVSTTFKLIEKLNKHHSGLFHWHIAPLMNPDGLLKKRASRTNHNGVDLNRNMPSSDWHSNALKYWKTKSGKNPRRYPGEKPSSEPETQWLVDEINAFKPDAIISIHAPYGVVDFDSLRLNTAPKSLGKLHLNLLGTYPGSLGNYAGINRNIPVITLELPHAWNMPSDTEITQIWQDIVTWLKININK